MIFDQFDSIRIINLPYRTDRRAEMEGELARIGLLDDPRVAFFKAFQFDDAGPFSSPGARGVFQSHLTILEEAASNEHRVLILEDDCDFIPDASAYVPPKPWSIFYGGYEAQDPSNLLASDIIGAHMMGFSPETAAHLADYLKNLSYEGMHPPIDGAYIWYRRAFPDVTTIFAEPALGHQRPSRTDIAELRFFDKIPVVREVAGLGRKLKRALNR
ncbi:hypothetical protein [Parasphingorhabdus cellanae]|uniref:Glycosyl transferase n=1 Tax=Parasphingorhabdus cellanae TaxID=2806553 RepID=A0ABX7T3V2_9SPHN|nr:hypothetical protein [Parasphingorhabdus cellanae]QTD56254.1 hypothetical protein J4G78_01210 [Parasphingorhabdus cellanae]